LGLLGFIYIYGFTLFIYLSIDLFIYLPIDLLVGMFNYLFIYTPMETFPLMVPHKYARIMGAAKGKGTASMHSCQSQYIQML